MHAGLGVFAVGAVAALCGFEVGCALLCSSRFPEDGDGAEACGVRAVCGGGDVGGGFELGQFDAGAVFGNGDVAFAGIVGEVGRTRAALGVGASKGVLIAEADGGKRFGFADAGHEPGALPLAFADGADGFVELAAIGECEGHAGFGGGSCAVGQRECAADDVELAAGFGRAAFACDGQCAFERVALVLVGGFDGRGGFEGSECAGFGVDGVTRLDDDDAERFALVVVAGGLSGLPGGFVVQFMHGGLPVVWLLSGRRAWLLSGRWRPAVVVGARARFPAGC